MSQGSLPIELPAPQGANAPPPTRAEEARLRRPVRTQARMMVRDLDSLVADDHPVRAIWEFLQGMELSVFYGSIKAVVDRASGH